MGTHWTATLPSCRTVAVLGGAGGVGAFDVRRRGCHAFESSWWTEFGFVCDDSCGGGCAILLCIHWIHCSRHSRRWRSAYGARAPHSRAHHDRFKSRGRTAQFFKLRNQTASARCRLELSRCREKMQILDAAFEFKRKKSAKNESFVDLSCFFLEISTKGYKERSIKCDGVLAAVANVRVRF